MIDVFVAAGEHKKAEDLWENLMMKPVETKIEYHSFDFRDYSYESAYIGLKLFISKELRLDLSTISSLLLDVIKYYLSNRIRLSCSKASGGGA